MDTLILFAILTVASIPPLLVLRWYASRDPDTGAAFDDVRHAWGAFGRACADALGTTRLLDWFEAFLARFDRT